MRSHTRLSWADCGTETQIPSCHLNLSVVLSGYLYSHGHLTRAVCCRMARNGQEFAQSLSAPFMLNHPEVCLTSSTVCNLWIVFGFFFKILFHIFSPLSLLAPHTVVCRLAGWVCMTPRVTPGRPRSPVWTGAFQTSTVWRCWMGQQANWTGPFFFFECIIGLNGSLNELLFIVVWHNL